MKYVLLALILVGITMPAHAFERNAQQQPQLRPAPTANNYQSIYTEEERAEYSSLKSAGFLKRNLARMTNASSNQAHKGAAEQLLKQIQLFESAVSQ